MEPSRIRTTSTLLQGVAVWRHSSEYRKVIVIFQAGKSLCSQGIWKPRDSYLLCITCHLSFGFHLVSWRFFSRLDRNDSKFTFWETLLLNANASDLSSWISYNTTGAMKSLTILVKCIEINCYINFTPHGERFLKIIKAFKSHVFHC